MKLPSGIITLLAALFFTSANATAKNNHNTNASSRRIVDQSLHKLTIAYACRDVFGADLYPLVREEEKSKLKAIGAPSKAIADMLNTLEKILQSTDAIGRIDSDECFTGR
jgi:hypothetical protein